MLDVSGTECLAGQDGPRVRQLVRLECQQTPQTRLETIHLILQGVVPGLERPHHHHEQRQGHQHHQTHHNEKHVFLDDVHDSLLRYPEDSVGLRGALD